MSQFEDLSYHGKCDVCGQETDVVVAASSCAPASFTYCRRCLEKKREPYNFLLSRVAGAGHWPDGVRPAFQKLVRGNLAFYGKTEEEFAAAVEQMIQKESEET